MKKILAIAVASVIATPAMADLTIGGSIEARYRAVDTVTDTAAVTALTAAQNGGIARSAVAASEARAKDAGIGLDNAQLNIKASDTLENGMTVAAAFDVDNLYRAATASGNDATLSISGDFGSVMVGQVEAGNGIIGLGGAGAPAEVLDGTVIAGAGNVSMVKYTAPAMGAFTLSASHTEGMGVGTGLASTATTVGVKAVLGAATVAADTTQPQNGDYVRYRLSGNVNLGSVVIGAGYESKNLSSEATTATAGDYVDTIVGVSLPMGDATVGATMMSHDSDITGQDASGYSFGASYKVSGNLTAALKYAAWKDQSDDNNQSQTQTTASLKYSF